MRADYRQAKPGTPRRRSGWILGRHKPQPPRQLSRCRAPTLLSAGSRSPTPSSASPRATRAEEAPAATPPLPSTRARAPFSGPQGELRASWTPGLGRGLRAWEHARAGDEIAPGTPGLRLLRNKRKVRTGDWWVGLGSGVGTPWHSRVGSYPHFPNPKELRPQRAGPARERCVCRLGALFFPICKFLSHPSPPAAFSTLLISPTVPGKFKFSV